MKILQISASYKPAYIYGGPTISVSTLCEQLVKSGKSVEVLTSSANGKEEVNAVSGELVIVDTVPVRYFKRITGDHSHLSPSLLTFLFKNITKYNIIHIHAWWNLVSVGAALICFLRRKKFVLSPRGTLSYYSFYNKTSIAKRTFHKVIGKAILKSAIFQVSSKKEVLDVTRLIPGAKTFVIPNFINLNAAWAVKSLNEQRPFLKLLYFSRIEQKKGLEFLLQALDKITFDFTLDIYGMGEEEYVNELKSQVPERSKSKVQWKGVVYGDKKFEVLSEYDLMILPSYDENFANVVIECLAVGTAVFLTPDVGLSDYVQEKNLGWICKQSAVEIADKLEWIITHKEELQRIRETSPAIIKEDFSETRLLNSYRQFYSSLDIN